VKVNRKRFLAAAEIALLVLTGFFLFKVLDVDHGVAPSPVRDYITENGSRETGALNLVTSIYLGYRAFDTLGETMVLMIAVTGVLFFLVDPGKEGKDDEENQHP